LLILIFLLHNRLNGIKGMVILRSMARSFISSMVMGAFIYLIYSKVLGKYIAQSTLTLILGLSITISSGIAIYFVLAKLLGSEEIVSIKEIFACTSNPLKSKPQ